MEFISGSALSVFYIIFGMNIFFFQVTVLFYILLVLSFIDVEMGIVPYGIVIFGAAAGVLMIYIEKGSALTSNLIGALVGFVLVLFSYFLGRIILKKDAIGGGDLYLTAMLGLYLGWQKIITAYFLSFLIAGVFIILLSLKLKKVPRDMKIPFGPFLSVGGFLGLIVGDKINNFYVTHFMM